MHCSGCVLSSLLLFQLEISKGLEVGDCEYKFFNIIQEGETVADLIQSNVARYGDDSGMN